jgi:hypothetical protein
VTLLLNVVGLAAAVQVQLQSSEHCKHSQDYDESGQGAYHHPCANRNGDEQHQTEEE